MSATKSDESTIGIAGAGAIACGFAVAAAHHSDVVLWSRSESSAAKARKKIDTTLQRLETGIDPNKIAVTTDIGDLSAASAIVEAIREDLGDKSALLAQLGQIAGEQALLSSTTSSLSVEALAEASGAPERFVGLHVFNPVPKMQLVELIFATRTTEEIKDRARSLCAALDKTAVEVPDIAGFVVNRLLFPYLFDAVRLQEETGLDAEAIDTCMQLGAGHPMGPLALLDYVGLDVSQAIGEAIGAELPGSLLGKIEAGELGKKSRKGFYSYE
jgi:3-hydroxybutyryl-CoA dehydrogenase